MPFNSQEALKLARLKLAQDALKKMFLVHGANFTFPFDLIWQNLPSGTNVPSVNRPSQMKPLIDEGWIEQTGAMTRAVSEARAGSATPEYRFGPKLVPASKTPTPTSGPPPIGDQLKQMQLEMDKEGYVISTAELTNFFLAMMVSPLVILSGISGVGKSLLPRQFAKHSASGFHQIPVQPQWTDNSDLFGYVPTLAPDKFIEGRLVQGLREALADKSKLVIALLDEMNLAPVEHYFSDFLSVAETRIRVGTSINTDKLPLDLPPSLTGQPDAYRDLRGIGLPHNLRVVGTANMDETTRSFSPKVLDRAFTIEFDDPDLTQFAAGSAGSGARLTDLAAAIVREANPITVLEARDTGKDLFEQVSVIIQDIFDILSPSGIKFGYRTRDAILLYLFHWRRLALENVLAGNAALDFCFLQKILPKISGSGDALNVALGALADWLRRDRKGTLEESPLGFNGPFTRSLQKVERMKALLESDGATHYWGV